MRKLLLALSAGLLGFAANAQNYTADFEALSLSKPDTFYVNESNPGTDQGFNNGMLHFPYYYDSSFGGLWNGGFAYSNMTDSVTDGPANMYSAKAAKGALNSEKYVVFNPGYGGSTMISTSSHQQFIPQNVYLTNSTYTYNSMRSGDGFAKKFGGASGNDSDWFKLTIYAWSNGVLKGDSVEFFLADYRFGNNSLDYLVNDWRLVNLSSLGAVDSLSFSLSSSDNGSFGMNTPAYFCMDNLSIVIPATGVAATPALARVYPNPALSELHVDLLDAGLLSARVLDMSGRLVASYPATGTQIKIPTAALQPGVYILQLEGTAGQSAIRFVKQ